jgi:hypothetical protein
VGARSRGTYRSDVAGMIEGVHHVDSNMRFQVFIDMGRRLPEWILSESATDILNQRLKTVLVLLMYFP